jgi:WD40 repeat protein
MADLSWMTQFIVSMELSYSRREAIIKFINSLSEDEIAFTATIVGKHSANSSAHVHTLANEILTIIFGYIQNCKSFAACSLVCRKWKEVLDENFLWKILCVKHRYFPVTLSRNILTSRQLNSSWKCFFKQNHLTKRNWERGQYRVSNLNNRNHSGFICVDFDEFYAFSIKRGHPASYWSLENGNVHSSVHHPAGNFTAAKLNGHHIILGFDDGSLRVWDIKAGGWKWESPGHNEEIGTLSLHGDLIASGSEDSTIRVLIH